MQSNALELQLNIYEGKLHRDTETFGQMDPFLIVKDSHGRQFKTKVIDDAGKNPVWNDTLTIPIEGREAARYESVNITCYDEDLIMDSHVGSGDFTVRELLCKEPKWINLMYRGQKAAEIYIKAKLVEA